MTSENLRKNVKLPPLCPALPQHLLERVRVIGSADDRVVRRDAEYVLCWIHHAFRDHENAALDVALTIGNALDRPVLVYAGLGGAHKFNSDRSHTFILEGARTLACALQNRRIAFAFNLQRDPRKRSPLRALAADACCVVTEDFPAPPMPRWTEKLANRIETPVLAVDSSCILPVRLLNQQFTRAFAFREAATPHWETLLKSQWPLLQPTVAPLFLSSLPHTFLELESLDDEALNDAIAQCDIDHSVAPVPHLRGGSDAGYLKVDQFIANSLKSYDKRRNNAVDTHAVSGLSPYFHFGFISAFRVAKRVRRIGGAGASKWLDELLVWRELAFNYCAFTSSDTLDTLDAVPAWARQTLHMHERDERTSLLTLERLEKGESDSTLWNYAQLCLYRNGELHNNLRMTWGKSILLWTKTPKDALDALLTLNHKFALDGCNPASYGGLLWCMGLFDRPFKPEQLILGTVRPRELSVHERRVDSEQYKAAIAKRGKWRKRESRRVTLIGNGVLTLLGARLLASYGVSVCIVSSGGERASEREREREEREWRWECIDDARLRTLVDALRDDGALLWRDERILYALDSDGDERLVKKVRVLRESEKGSVSAWLRADLLRLGGDKVEFVQVDTHQLRVLRDEREDLWRLSTSEDVDDRSTWTSSDAIVIVVSAAGELTLANSSRLMQRNGLIACAGASSRILCASTWHVAVVLCRNERIDEVDCAEVDIGRLVKCNIDDEEDGLCRWIVKCSVEWCDSNPALDEKEVCDRMVQCMERLFGSVVVCEVRAELLEESVRTPTSDPCFGDRTTRSIVCGHGWHSGVELQQSALSAPSGCARALRFVSELPLKSTSATSTSTFSSSNTNTNAVNSSNEVSKRSSKRGAKKKESRQASLTQWVRQSPSASTSTTSRWSPKKARTTPSWFQ